MAARTKLDSVESLLSTREVIIACGPGGVGKTTTAASVAAVAAAYVGGNVLVVTVDPAKRLADALGIKGDDSPEECVHRCRSRTERNIVGCNVGHEGELGCLD